MARTVKVSKEKAMQERAREAGDEKIKRMERLREKNQMRAQGIKKRRENNYKL